MNDGKYNELELLFIEEVLSQHGEFLTDLLTEDIERKRLRDSDELINSIQYKVSKYGIDPVLLVNFMSYGRAIEIRWHKRSNNTKNWTTDTNREVWNINQNRKKKKKNTLWYARNVYGSQNRLIAILSNEFTEEEKTRLKGILDKQKIRIAL